MTSTLKNKVFILTRPKNQSAGIVASFENEGATLLEFPLIETKARQLSAEEKSVLQNIAVFDWLVFTSANGVKYFFERQEVALSSQINIAVIGKKTEESLNKYGYRAKFVNPGTTGEDFAEYFYKFLLKKSKNLKLLFILGNLAPNTLSDKISEIAGCSRVDIYKTTAPQKIDKNILHLIQNNRYEMVLFTSPSAIDNFVLFNRSGPVKNLKIACIGETTAKKARECGIEPLVIANPSTLSGLFESIKNYYQQKQKTLQL